MSNLFFSRDNFRRRFNAGFSTIEALIWIILVSVATALIVALSSITIKSLSVTREKVHTAVNTLSTDTALRSAIGRIRIPWWEYTAHSTASGKEIIIPWLDGSPEKNLAIRLENGRMYIRSSPENTVIYISGNTMQDLSFAPLKDERGAEIGIELQYGAQPKFFICKAFFASHALGNK